MEKNIASRRPTVTVLMPVFNAEAYLKKAIESILKQTFKDYELLVINDGSSDSSLEIINNFAKNDDRIRCVSRGRRGIGYTLNEGISLAKGRFIARMDADDISAPDRLMKELDYLTSHPECDALFSRVQLIDVGGKSLGVEWEPDSAAIKPEEIKKYLPKENCCAHPTLMIRTETLRHFKYDARQVPSEDYDLWLRLISAGNEIHKLDEKLLLYRMHGASISQSSNQSSSPQKKILKAKYRFLLKQSVHMRFGSCERDVLLSLLHTFTFMTYRKLVFTISRFVPKPIVSFKNRSRSFIKIGLQQHLRVARHIKAHIHIALNRVGLLVWLYSHRSPKKDKHVAVVIPWMTIGGAEKVALDLIEGLSDSGYFVSCISTIKKDNKWAHLYAKNSSQVVDIGAMSLNENKAWFIAKYVQINKIRSLLTSNNYPGYWSTELIKKNTPDVKIVDLLHGQGGDREEGGWPQLSVPYDKYIYTRIVATHYLKRLMQHKHKISAKKITVVHYGIKQFHGPAPKAGPEIAALNNKFIILWAGRFSYEKHPELVVRTAEVVSKKNKDIHFVIVGDGEMKPELKKMVVELSLEDFVTIADKPYSDPRSYMCYANVLLMSSEMEGLPVVILEAMMAKLPVIAPKVGGIPEEVHDGNNGYLIPYSFDFPRMAAEKIMYLSKNIDTAKEMGENGYRLAQTEFSMSKMIDEYIKILEI